MHLSEFQAWFEGFTEEMKGPPNKDQWGKIKKRVKEITADYTPAPIFIERYYEPWRRYWIYQPCWTTLTGVGVSTTGGTPPTSSAASYNLQGSGTTAAISLEDWTAAGRAEYRAA